MQGEDGQHAASPRELKYLTLLSGGKLLCQTLPSVLESELDGLTTNKALRVGCLTINNSRLALLEGNPVNKLWRGGGWGNYLD